VRVYRKHISEPRWKFIDHPVYFFHLKNE
jgi:hypothetical protein